MKQFSCKHFFGNVEKDKIFRRYFVDISKKPAPCEPDFRQNENEIHYAPEEHLIRVHGFLQKVPEKKRRALEIKLCKSIEETLIDVS